MTVQLQIPPTTTSSGPSGFLVSRLLAASKYRGFTIKTKQVGVWHEAWAETPGGGVVAVGKGKTYYKAIRALKHKLDGKTGG
jgi:hypothetical protein